MARFDRYIVRQLMTLFLVFCLILVTVYWINRAVILFDQLIANGHSALVFLEFTSLNLPNLVRIVLPVAGFVAVIWGINRLSADSELIIARATGFSPWRLARPIAIFGLSLALLLSLLSHFLVPLAEGRLAQREAEISRDLTARFLREGEFVHPSRDVTFFVSDVEPEKGILRDILLFDASDDQRHLTYTARRGVFRRDAETAHLVMLDGMVQSRNLSSNTLSVTAFEDLVYDISEFLTAGKVPRSKPAEFTTWRLLTRTEEAAEALRTDAAGVRAILHERLAEALLAPVAALIGFGALVSGSFSRLGLWRQIGWATALIVLVKAVDNAAIATVRKAPDAWPALYSAPLVGALLAAALLWWAARPLGWPRRRPTEPAEQPA